jgi:hypothetical protein
MKEMPKLKCIDKLPALLSILNILNTSEEYVTISSFKSVSISTKDSKRIDTICESVINNFKKPISLKKFQINFICALQLFAVTLRKGPGNHSLIF